MAFPTFFDITEASKNAKQYLIDEVQSGNRVRPIATFYRLDMPIFTVKFPLTETHEDRQKSFAQLAWLNGSLRGDGVLFAIDSAIPLTTHDGETYNQDMFLIFFSNKMGAFADPICYIHSKDTNTVEWVDRDIKPEDIMDSQQQIMLLLASQFFLAYHTVPWEPYVDYLKEKGFEFTFHEPFNNELVGFAQSYLHN